MRQITGTFTNSDGSPVSNGTVYFQLSQDAVAAGGTQVSSALPISISLDKNGRIPSNTEIWFNDELNPSGTTYKIFALDRGGALCWSSHGGVSLTTALGTAYTNIALSSEQFSNSSVWVPANSPVVTADFAGGPFGGTTADRVVFPTGAGAGSRLVQSFSSAAVAGNIMCHSVWLKSNTGSNISGMSLLIRETGPNTVWAQNNIPSITTSWQRYFCAGQIPSTSAGVGIWIYNIGNVASLDVLCFGEQFELGSSPNLYLPTTTSPVTGYLSPYSVNNVVPNLG